MSYRVLGIDPGIHGAFAVVDLDMSFRSLVLAAAFDLPTFTGERALALDLNALAQAWSVYQPDLVVIEEVHAAPGQGVASTFRFGRATGELIGLAVGLGHRVHCISPQNWQRLVHVSGDKAEHRRRAGEMTGRNTDFLKVKDTNKADAVLVAIAGGFDGLQESGVTLSVSLTK